MVPLAQLTLQAAHKSAQRETYWFRILNMVLPLPLKPIPVVCKELTDDIELIQGNRAVVSLITILGMILTFGAVFPPLAASFLLTALSLMYFTQYKIGNLLSGAKEQNESLLVKRIEQECTAIGTAPILMNSMWILIIVSACFYTLFLFDTLGNAVGPRSAYWVLILMPLIPMCMCAVYKLYSRYSHNFLRNFRNIRLFSGSAKDIELENPVIALRASEVQMQNTSTIINEVSASESITLETVQEVNNCSHETINVFHVHDV